LKRCLGLSPTYEHEVLTNLGISYLMMGGHDDAAKSMLRQALVLNPDNHVAQKHLDKLKGKK
jgi:Flp pilus assembly protein TadD